MTDFETPMGNAELRLSLANIESEVADVKSIAMDVHTQAKKTNGRVNWLEKLAYISMGALPLLTVWAGWLTLIELSNLNKPPDSVVIQEAVNLAVKQAIQQYGNQTN